MDIKNIIGHEKPVVKIDKKLIWHHFSAFADCDQNLDYGFEITESNENIFKTILSYFSGDEDFNKYGVIKNNASLSKGLLVYGDFGVGKSKFFELIMKTGREIIKETGNARMHFRNISCGSFVKLYMSMSSKPHLDFELENYYKGNLYIDDLGIEPLAFNSYELLESVLFERHKNNATTFITTNMTVSQISERYGERIGDRLTEMFNFIEWRGKSFRTTK